MEVSSAMIKDNQKFNESIIPNSALMAELRQKLPEFFTAAKYDENGKLVESSKFDNDKFQQALQKQNVNELSSGYRLDFIGKNYAKKQAGEKSETVIVPDVEHNEKPENKNSNNLFFTGDNLEVLRHLQQNYTNSIDFIYIDPPYNTGSDGFVYPDKFEYSDDQLQDMFGLNDDELKRMKSIQGKSTHSAWLAFMYPRLYLAKKLLKDSGVIFISIDDNEQANLKLVMDEIFGEGQYLASAPRKTGAGSAATRSESELRKLNDYVFIYSRNNFNFKQKIVGEKKYPYHDEHGDYLLAQFQASGSDATRSARPNMWYPIYVLSNGELTTLKNDSNVKTIFPKEVNGLEGRWMWKPDRFERDKKIFIDFHNDKISRKVYYDATQDQTKYQSEKAWFEKFPNKNGTTYLNELFQLKGLFSNPKPIELIKFFLNLENKNDFIALDFFAGSATTADAVMQLNAEDGGHRKYVMAQLPEKTKTTSAAYKAGYKTIDQISRARIEKAAAKMQAENPLLVQTQDLGFKHYRFVKPNQQTLDKIEYNGDLQLNMFDDMISQFSSESLGVKGNATGFDTILQTYLVADNYKFDVPVKIVDFAGIKVPYVNDQRVYIIANDWGSDNTKALVNAIGTNKMTIQTVVVFGYPVSMEHLRELEIALNQLENKVNLLVRY